MSRARKEPKTGVPDQLKTFQKEVAAGSWLANAQTRARRRKSPWNLLLPALGYPLWGAIAFALVWVSHQVRFLLLGGPDILRAFMAGPVHASSFLVLIPSLMAAIAPAFIVANFLVYLLPPARRAMEAEDRNFPALAYGPSQSALARIAGWLMLGWVATTLLACALQ